MRRTKSPAQAEIFTYVISHWLSETKVINASFSSTVIIEQSQGLFIGTVGATLWVYKPCSHVHIDCITGVYICGRQ